MASSAITFDGLAYRDDSGEWWSARELQEPAGYASWQKWSKAIERAHASMINSMY